MTIAPPLTPELRAGRRTIELFSSVQLLSDLTWFDAAQVWGVCCRFTIDSVNPELVPTETDWWLTLEPCYPYGKITVRPAILKGLTRTFAHQQFNGLRSDSLPWRTGDICVRSPQFIFGKSSLDPDPIGQIGRLGWYIRRTNAWLKAASAGHLTKAGDPFELPAFPRVTTSLKLIAHAETEETLITWTASKKLVGMAELVAVGPSWANTFAVTSFFDKSNTPILSYKWGRAIDRSSSQVQRAIWLRCDDLPVNPPYHAIDCWGDLFAYLQQQNRLTDFGDSLDWIRDGEPHVLLLGFTIPRNIGEAGCQLHWQPILVPTLSHGKNFQNGFRPNRLGYLMRDKFDVFTSTKKLDWHDAANWSLDEVTCRGRIDLTVSKCCALVIGAGAVGSVVAELLVRAGLARMIICDGDTVEHGNLCRHTLRLEDIARSKAIALAQRLSAAHAQADVQAIADSFPVTTDAELALTEGCEVILDCTGEDATLHSLASRQWHNEKTFCSISLSYQATRIYVFVAKAKTFPLSEFLCQYAPWAEKDASTLDGEKLIQAGIGCWHPAFPARIDDVWGLAAAAVRAIEEALMSNDGVPRLIVFERVFDNGRFAGIRRI